MPTISKLFIIVTIALQHAVLVLSIDGYEHAGNGEGLDRADTGAGTGLGIDGALGLESGIGGRSRSASSVVGGDDSSQESVVRTMARRIEKGIHQGTALGFSQTQHERDLLNKELQNLRLKQWGESGEEDKETADRLKEVQEKLAELTPNSRRSEGEREEEEHVSGLHSNAHAVDPGLYGSRAASAEGLDERTRRTAGAGFTPRSGSGLHDTMRANHGDEGVSDPASFRDRSNSMHLTGDPRDDAGTKKYPRKNPLRVRHSKVEEGAEAQISAVDLSNGNDHGDILESSSVGGGSSPRSVMEGVRQIGTPLHGLARARSRSHSHSRSAVGGRRFGRANTYYTVSSRHTPRFSRSVRSARSARSTESARSARGASSVRGERSELMESLRRSRSPRSAVDGHIGFNSPLHGVAHDPVGEEIIQRSASASTLDNDREGQNGFGDEVDEAQRFSDDIDKNIRQIRMVIGDISQRLQSTHDGIEANMKEIEDLVAFLDTTPASQ